MKKKSIEDLLKQYNVSQALLERLYVTNKASLPDVKLQTGLPYRATCRLLKHFAIPIRSISEARKTDKFKKKLQNSLERKYGRGITNVSQIKSVKLKKEEGCLKKYGVTNIRKSRDYYKWLDAFMLEKYGTKRTGFLTWTKEQRSDKTKIQWRNLSSLEREQKIEKQLKNLHSVSSSRENKLEREMAQTLDFFTIPYERFYHFKHRIYDFYLPHFNLLIEVNGDYWHGNPKKYKKGDVLKFPGNRSVLVEDLWEKDKKKIDLAIKNGFNALTLWESDKKEFKSIFSNEIKKYQENRMSIEKI